MNDDDFGGRLKRSNPLKDEMKVARIDTISNFKDKVVATYKLLHQYVKWNGSYALTGNTSHNVLKEGKASHRRGNLYQRVWRLQRTFQLHDITAARSWYSHHQHTACRPVK